MLEPVVSILMTCFNAESTIIESIQSIVRQSHESWELIIVDNGSTDKTLALISEYTDSRIRIVPLSDNVGRTTALNLGLSLAQGQYIAILDADDTSEPSRLSRQVELLNFRNDVVGVSTFFATTDLNGKELARYSFDINETAIKRQMAHNLLLVHSSMMYRRNSCAVIGGYKAEFHYAADFALWLDLIKIGNIATIPEYLTNIRINQNSMTRDSNFEKFVILEALQLYIEAQRISDLRIIDRLRGFRTITFLTLKYFVYCLKKFIKIITSGTK